MYKMTDTERPDDGAIQRESRSQFPLMRLNFILMAVAGLLIVVGFLLMTGKAATATEFNPDIFSTRRIVVGPTVAFLGFLFMGFAIMYNGRRAGHKSDADELD